MMSVKQYEYPGNKVTMLIYDDTDTTSLSPYRVVTVNTATGVTLATRFFTTIGGARSYAIRTARNHNGR